MSTKNEKFPLFFLTEKQTVFASLHVENSQKGHLFISIVRSPADAFRIYRVGEIHFYSFLYLTDDNDYAIITVYIIT